MQCSKPVYGDVARVVGANTARALALAFALVSVRNLSKFSRCSCRTISTSRTLLSPSLLLSTPLSLFTADTVIGLFIDVAGVGLCCVPSNTTAISKPVNNMSTNVSVFAGFWITLSAPASTNCCNCLSSPPLTPIIGPQKPAVIQCSCLWRFFDRVVHKVHW